MGTVVQFPNIGLEFTINRVAFRIGEFEFYWYGILIGLGLLLGMWFALSKAKSFGLDPDRFIDVILIGAVAGIVGARLYYVVFSAPGEFTTFWDIFNLRRGGLGFYGAVIFGVGAGVLACRWRKLRILPVCDLAAFGFLIGQGIGRWGNFFNQEAFGGNTDLPWGMLSTSTQNYLAVQLSDLAEKGMTVNPSMPVHPTFLYEFLWCLLGFVLLYLYIKRRKFDGEIFLMYVAWNGFGRAFIEGLRTDSLYIGSLRVSQVLAIVGAISAIVIIGIIRNKIKNAEEEHFLMPFGFTAEAKNELEMLEEKRNAVKAKKSVESAVAEPTEPEIAEPEPEEPKPKMKSAKKPKKAVEEPVEKSEPSAGEPEEVQETPKPKKKTTKKKPAAAPEGVEAPAVEPEQQEAAEENNEPTKKTYKSSRTNKTKENDN